MIIDEQCLAILKKIIKNEDCKKKIILNCVYYSHLVLLNNYFNLKMNQLNAIAIWKYLLLTYVLRKNLKIFKTSFIKNVWFKMIKRSQMIDDDLIHFRYRFDIALFLKFLRITKVKQIIDEIIENETWNSWHKSDNLIISDLFFWIFDDVMSNNHHEIEIAKLMSLTKL